MPTGGMGECFLKAAYKSTASRKPVTSLNDLEHEITNVKLACLCQSRSLL